MQLPALFVKKIISEMILLKCVCFKEHVLDVHKNYIMLSFTRGKVSAPYTFGTRNYTRFVIIHQI